MQSKDRSTIVDHTTMGKRERLVGIVAEKEMLEIKFTYLQSYSSKCMYTCDDRAHLCICTYVYP